MKYCLIIFLRDHRMKHLPILFLLAVSALWGDYVHAQVYSRIIVHKGDSLSEHYTYRFPSFADAVIKFRNGKVLTYKLNYNTFLCEMQFIDPKGDTLSISNPEEIDSIRLNDRVFFYNKDYYEILAACDSIKLAVLRQGSFELVKLGGNGLPIVSGGVDSYTSMTARWGTIPLSVNEDIYALTKTSYFLIARNGEMVIAAKPAFLKMFGGDKKNFDAFVKAKKINFNMQEDLVKLFHYCTEGKM